MAIPDVRGQSGGPDILNASGGHSVTGGRMFEWSVAEMVITTETSPSLVITQGLLQPMGPAYNTVQDVIPASLLQVFPNPTTSLVNVSFESPGEGALACRLTDITGKLLMEENADVKKGTTTKQLDLRKLANATYVLHVTYNEGDKTTNAVYKIQKLN